MEEEASKLTENKEIELANKQQPTSTLPFLSNNGLQQPIFHPIIDVFSELQRGNFKPYLVCLQENYIPKEFIDPAGYNLLHYAASYNDVPLAYYLLSEMRIDVNIRSNSQQTALMIASNFGSVEMMRLLIDFKADQTLRDSCQFTALLYAVKQNHVPAVIHLINKGSDVGASDSNGCTLVHWASFKNNLFLLRLFKTLGFNLNTVDLKGYTPFQRAFSNDSYDSIKFLLEESDVNVLPEKMNVHEIKSDCIRQMVEKKLAERDKKFCINRFFWEFWEKNPKKHAFISYLLFFLISFYGFLNGVFYKPENDYYIMNILFMVLAFYFILYLYLFIYKLVFPKTKIPENNEVFEENDSFTKKIKIYTQKDAQEMSSVDFSALESIFPPELKNSHTSVTVVYDEHNEMMNIPTHNWTFLHYIAYLVEKLRFTEAMDMETSRLCPTCLTFKMPKTKHCRYCKECVPYYNHHSHIFGRCINYKSHAYYMVLLTLQEILLFFYLFLQISIYSPMRNSYTFLAFFETAYLLGKNDGFVIFAIYLLIAICLFYNSVFWMIESFGVLSNQTYNEIFNRHKCSYLYSNWNDARGRTWKVYTNATSQGIRKNIMRYSKRCLS